jgi:hypothetical protein
VLPHPLPSAEIDAVLADAAPAVENEAVR